MLQPHRMRSRTLMLRFVAVRACVFVRNGCACHYGNAVSMQSDVTISHNYNQVLALCTTDHVICVTLLTAAICSGCAGGQIAGLNAVPAVEEADAGGWGEEGVSEATQWKRICNVWMMHV